MHLPPHTDKNENCRCLLRIHLGTQRLRHLHCAFFVYCPHAASSAGASFGVAPSWEQTNAETSLASRLIRGIGQPLRRPTISTEEKASPAPTVSRTSTRNPGCSHSSPPATIKLPCSPRVSAITSRVNIRANPDIWTDCGPPNPNQSAKRPSSDSFSLRTFALSSEDFTISLLKNGVRRFASKKRIADFGARDSKCSIAIRLTADRCASVPK